MNTTVTKIETILKSSYDTKKYVDLVMEIFPTIHLVAPDRFRKEFSNFSSHIEGSIHVGNYQTKDNKKIIVMTVQLNKSRYVENARSIQRNYAKKLIENGNADAAFIAYYTEGDSKWRLSFVRLDYEMKIENDRLKTAENMTPAKRYSYLVGQEEPCHTAISRLNRFITDSESNPEHPTLDDLEEIFSVEKVTNEFFNLYCEKYQQLRELLEANEDFRIEAEQHNYSSVQFAKKLMGQIVFLYFLQKKGWLGVGAWPRSLSEKEYKNAFFARGAKSRELIPIVYHPAGDGTYHVSGAALDKLNDSDEEVLAACVKGSPWGSGPRDFMRKLFELAVKRDKNFYDDVLEPLFYDALNRNRGEQGYCPALHCRIPFLSGGLFEPIDGYDWEHNNFNLPNSIFSNSDIKGRDADGILDIFDRYNFTMSEDEPMEREVAIDPEMLGKVFENLLDVKDRKSKGAFYTPREIVHYMCQESLINYLTTTLNMPEAPIRDFILYGDLMVSEDTVKEKRQGNGDLYIDPSLFKIENDGTVSVNKLKDMDVALTNVRIADPAVGSGAFPLGMLNEIVKARQNISAYYAITMKPYDIRMMYSLERSPHELKYQTIKNCIFAADIEPSAVDIAQLRLWLSLVIDDEINPDAQTPLDGHRNPLPLPNLESNILCGNSLIDEFEGTKLFTTTDLLGNKRYQIGSEQDQYETILKKLIDAQNELFKCDNADNKKELKEQIESYREMIIGVQLSECEDKVKQDYYLANKQTSKPFVLWQLDFARVFREKGGFDIIISNPPYVGEKGHKDIFRPIAATQFGKRYYLGKMDLFYFFFHKAMDIGCEKAEIAFITTNYYPTAFGGKLLRHDFKTRSQIRQLINFNELKIFESALGQHNMITILTKNQCFPIIANTKICKISGVADTILLERILRTSGANNEYFDRYSVAQHDLYEGNEYYIRLIGCGIDDGISVNSILNRIANAEHTLKQIAFIKQGIVSGADKYTDALEADFKLGFPKGMGIFVLRKDELEALHIPEKEFQYVKHVYKNSQISKYHIEYGNDLYVFYITKGVTETDAPTIIHYLEQFKPILASKRETITGKLPWYCLHWPREKDIFESAGKIVNSRRAKGNVFALETQQYFEQSDIMITVIKPEYQDMFPAKYVLALLNSKLFNIWLKNKGKLKGDLFELYGTPLEEIPIIKSSVYDRDRIVKLVDAIIDIKNCNNNVDTKAQENEIDQILYASLNLSSDEVKFIESDYKSHGL